MTSTTTSISHSYVSQTTSMGTPTIGSVVLTTDDSYSFTETTINEEAVDYSSPSYPSNYPNNQDVTTVITKPGATYIKVYFDDFITEGADNDYVDVLDGSDVFQFRYQGNLGQFETPFVTGNTIKLNFVSDTATTFKGWHVSKIKWLTI